MGLYVNDQLIEVIHNTYMTNKLGLVEIISYIETCIRINFNISNLA